MKALEILKTYHNLLVDNTMDLCDGEVYEAIEELERLLSGTCQGCVFDTKDLYSANCEYYSRLREDNYTREIKDNK